MIRKPTLMMIILASAIVLVAGIMKGPQASAIPLPVRTVASSANYCDKQANGALGFFGLEPWYHFMPDSEFGGHGDPCSIKCFNIFVQAQKNECGEKASDLPGVLLAIIDDLLRVAALAAVAFIIIGSFEYAGSRGNSERAASAQSTIITALIGLAVSLVAVALVSFLGGQLG